MPNELTTEKDRQVTIATDGKTETFSMVEIPPDGSALIKSARYGILQSLNLQNMIEDLGQTGDLLFLAYCGVAGFAPLRKGITEVQYELTQLMTRCSRALFSFQETCDQILLSLQNLFGYLLEGKEAWALDELKLCGEAAGAMADASQELANAFRALGNKTQKILGDTIIQQGLSEDKKRQLQEETNRLEVETAAAEAAREALARAKQKMERLYREAKEKADQEADRAFTLAIVSAIAEPIAAGIGAYAGAYQARGVNVPPPAPKPEKSQSGSKGSGSQAAAEDSGEADAEVEKLKTAEDTRKKTYEKEEKERRNVAKARIAELEKDAETDEEKAAAQAEREKEEKRQGEADTAEAARVKAAMEAISAATKAAADKMGALSQERAALAQTYNQEKMQYLNQLLKIEDKEYENLVNLAKYAKRMTQVAKAQEIEDRIIESLGQAMGALRRVVVILETNAGFWNQMADACENLQKNRLMADVERFKDEKDRVQRYLRPTFKTQVVKYYASWRALQMVTHEYSVIAAKVGGKMLEDFKKNPNKDQSRQLAVELGGKLAANVEGQLKLLEEKKQAYEAAKQEAKAAIA
jgi:hypothetical protein